MALNAKSMYTSSRGSNTKRDVTKKISSIPPKSLSSLETKRLSLHFLILATKIATRNAIQKYIDNRVLKCTDSTATEEWLLRAEADLGGPARGPMAPKISQ